MDSKARHLIHVLAPLVLVSTLITNTCAANQPSGYTQVSLGGTVAFDRSAHGTTCTNGHGRQHGSAGAPDTGPGGQFLYPVLPIGGNRDNADNDSSDLITNGYVDSDPSFGAFADHMCLSLIHI